MTRILRNASIVLALATTGLSLSASGCATKCNGNTCTTETTTQYVGTPKTVSAAWSSGQDLYIDLPSASVRKGDASTAITVNPGSGSDMSVTFTPFTSEVPEDKQKAIDEMNNNLHLSATNDGAVRVSATTSGTHGNALSAWVDIILPAGFNGRIIATPGNGDVSIKGAAAGVDVDTKLGDVLVQFTGALKATDTGHVTAGQGDITFDVVGASDFTIQALAGEQGKVIEPSPLPAGWVGSPQNVDASKSFTANAGDPAHPWKLDASGFFTSNILLKAHLAPGAATATPANPGGSAGVFA